MSITHGAPQAQSFRFANLFRGRLNRLQYFLLALMQFMLFVIVTVIFLSVIPDSNEDTGTGLGFVLIALLYTAFVIASAITTFSLAIRRGHDFGASGWWSLLIIVPYISLMYHLVLFFRSGEDAPNAYGDQPDPDIGLIGAFKGAE